MTRHLGWTLRVTVEDAVTGRYLHEIGRLFRGTSFASETRASVTQGKIFWLRTG